MAELFRHAEHRLEALETRSLMSVSLLDGASLPAGQDAAVVEIEDEDFWSDNADLGAPPAGEEWTDDGSFFASLEDASDDCSEDEGTFAGRDYGRDDDLGAVWGRVDDFADEGRGGDEVVVDPGEGDDEDADDSVVIDADPAPEATVTFVQSEDPRQWSWIDRAEIDRQKAAWTAEFGEEGWHNRPSWLNGDDVSDLWIEV